MKKLQLILNQLEYYIPDFEKTNPTVSNSTIGWQIDHSLIVINSVINQLKNSNPDTYKWKFNFWRNFFMIVNNIPRGKIKVPKSVTPIDVATIEELKTKLEMTRKNLDGLQILPDKSYFTHPYFGDLKLKSAIWFMKLHTNHHLKIIEDILKN